MANKTIIGGIVKNKIFLLVMLGVVLTFGMISCATPPTISANAANINEFTVDLDPSLYTILGKISATGKISINQATFIATGNTNNYGYVGDLNSALSVGQAITYTGSLGAKRTVISTPQGPANTARANAFYDLIQQAKEKDADAIIYITTDVKRVNDSKTEDVTVTVSGLAIKFINNSPENN